MPNIINETFVTHVMIIAGLLLCAFVFLLFKPRESMAIRCEKDHTKLLLQLSSTSSPAELQSMESLIEKFDEKYRGFVPKERIDRLTRQLYEATTNKRSQLNNVLK